MTTFQNGLAFQIRLSVSRDIQFLYVQNVTWFCNLEWHQNCLIFLAFVEISMKKYYNSGMVEQILTNKPSFSFCLKICVAHQAASLFQKFAFTRGQEPPDNFWNNWAQNGLPDITGATDPFFTNNCSYCSKFYAACQAASLFQKFDFTGGLEPSEYFLGQLHLNLFT